METTVKQCVPLNIVPYRGGYRARTQIEYADGNTQIKEFTGKSRGAVTQKMQDYLHLSRIPQEPIDARLTENFVDALETFFRTYRMPSLKRGSQDRIECTIRCQIIPAFGGLTVQQVDTDAIQQLLNRMAKDGYRFSTIKKAYLVLRPFFEYLVKTGAMSRSPLDSVRLVDPAKQRREQCSVSKLDMLRPLDEDEIGRAFTEEELAAFLTTLAKAYPNGTPFFRQAAAFRLILNTGLRTGELLALRNYHIDLSRRRILVRDNLTLVRKRENGVATSGCEMVIGSPKNGQSRYVPLNDEAIHCVQELRRERYFGEHAPLVCDKDGGYISPYNLRKRFYRILEQAGIRRKGLGVHSLRHTAATKWAVGNVPISEIAAILGQSTLSVTEMYIHAEQYTKGVTDSFNLK